MIQRLIRQSGIDLLDAELLLSHILKKDRIWLMAHAESKISDPEKSQFNALVTRRKNHEPIAYLIGEKEFYGRKFKVDKRVLIPRPSTETLIDEVKHLFNNNFEVETPRITQADSDIVILTKLFQSKPTYNTYNTYNTHNTYNTYNTHNTYNNHNTRNSHNARNTSPKSIADIGTGSGCIAITLALEIPNIKIIATDISADALDVAKENIKIHGVSDRISLVNCNLIPKMSKPFLIISNPPYIPDKQKLMEDVINFEPREALFGGEDGTDVIRSIVNASKSHPQCAGYVMEMWYKQALALASA